MDRVNTPFTNEHFVAFLKKFVGRPYWFGTCVYPCTKSLLAGKTNQYPSSYKESRQARYKRDIAAKEVCADCGGLGKGYAWTNGGIGVIESIGSGSDYASVYASNGCPDLGATSMFNYAKQKDMDWGTIDTLPELPGVFLWKSGHVGYYIGNGDLIEEKGFAYGCVISKISERNFTHWYKAPWIDYAESYGDANVPYPAIRIGATGHYVEIAQGYLVSLGYDLGPYGPNKDGVDGKFGTITDKAAREFQKSEGLKVDGLIGAITWAALKVRAENPEEPQEHKFTATITDLSEEDKNKVAEMWPQATFMQQ